MTIAYAPNCSLLVNNTAGNVQSLPDVRVGGKERVWIERIALAGQATTVQTMVSRLPYGSVPLTTVYDNAGVTTNNYEDVLLTIGVSSLPSTGTLVVVTKYIDYGA